MNSTDRKYIRIRMALVGLLFGLFLAVICGKAAYLQIYRGPWLSDLAAEQYEASVKSSGKRGTIYDRKMSEMAVSIPVTSIAAFPRRMADPATAAAAIAKPLKINRRSLVKNLKSKKSFIWIKRQATPREVEQVKQLNIEGIGFVPEYNRFYPQKTLAAQVIGFTGVDGEGLEGVEHYYNRALKGAISEQTFLRDAFGHRIVSDDKETPDFSGHNLILTIDQSIQFIAAETLEDTVREFEAGGGIVIVLEPKTGAVLAMAQYPEVNPNAYRKFKTEHWRNRAITDALEPGSTLKIFSATAGIEYGGLTSNSIFFCENGSYRVGAKVVRDTKSHGWLSLQQIIQYSSNIGVIKLSEDIGPEPLYNILTKFGFGSKTGIDAPGETPGSLSHYRTWTRMDTSAISFGHGVAVSPIQLVAAVSAIANKGVLTQPYLVSQITDQNNRVVDSFTSRNSRRVLSEEKARAIRNILKTVVAEDGTGANAALDGYSAGGKTGTAKKIAEDGTYSSEDYIASFIGFAPSEEPAICVLVIIDEPRKQYYGGTVAAPAFRRIAQETLNYLNVHPDSLGDQLAVTGSADDQI
jgi:cell division protein FtsI (penicillin-binding protein 3)